MVKVKNQPRKAPGADSQAAQFPEPLGRRSPAHVLTGSEPQSTEGGGAAPESSLLQAELQQRIAAALARQLAAVEPGPWAEPGPRASPPPENDTADAGQPAAAPGAEGGAESPGPAAQAGAEAGTGQGGPCAALPCGAGGPPPSAGGGGGAAAADAGAPPSAAEQGGQLGELDEMQELAELLLEERGEGDPHFRPHAAEAGGQARDGGAAPAHEVHERWGGGEGRAGLVAGQLEAAAAVAAAVVAEELAEAQAQLGDALRGRRCAEGQLQDSQALAAHLRAQLQIAQRVADGASSNVQRAQRARWASMQDQAEAVERRLSKAACAQQRQLALLASKHAELQALVALGSPDTPARPLDAKGSAGGAAADTALPPCATRGRSGTPVSSGCELGGSRVESQQGDADVGVEQGGGAGARGGRAGRAAAPPHQRQRADAAQRLEVELRAAVRLNDQLASRNRSLEAQSELREKALARLELENAQLRAALASAGLARVGSSTGGVPAETPPPPPQAAHPAETWPHHTGLQHAGDAAAGSGGGLGAAAARTGAEAWPPAEASHWHPSEEGPSVAGGGGSRGAIAGSRRRQRVDYRAMEEGGALDGGQGEEPARRRKPRPAPHSAPVPRPNSGGSVAVVGGMGGVDIGVGLGLGLPGMGVPPLGMLAYSALPMQQQQPQ